MKRLIGVLLAALVAVSTGAVSAAEEPYDFYAILPITGAVAFVGCGEEVTLRAFERYTNANGGVRGRPLHIIVQDDQSSPAVAVQIANQLIAKHVPAFVGPGFSATCSAVLPLVAANGPVMYCLSPAIYPPDGSYAFMFGLPAPQLNAVVLRYWKAKGVKKIALLTTTDASGQDGENAIHKELQLPEFAGMQVVAAEHYGTTDLAVTAQLARLKASGAEVLDLWTSGTPLGTGLRGLQTIGWDVPVMTSNSNAVPEQLAQYSAFMPRELLMASLGYTMIGVAKTTPGTRLAKATMLDALHQAGVADPALPNILPWDPMTLLIGAVRKLGFDADATQIRDYILSQSAFPGSNGMYNFSKTGMAGERNRGVDPMSSGVIRWDKDAKALTIVSKPGGMPL